MLQDAIDRRHRPGVHRRLRQRPSARIARVQLQSEQRRQPRKQRPVAAQRDGPVERSEADAALRPQGRLALIDDPATLETLAEEMGVTRERVRQIEVRAFEKLQKAMMRIAGDRLGQMARFAAA